MKAHTEAARKFLTEVIAGRLSADVFTLIESMKEQVSAFDSERHFNVSFSKIPRITGKTVLTLTEQEVSKAHAIKNGFTLQAWSIDRATRVLLILS
ncbi:MAG: hypothetical protein H7259_07875, partial [Cytophagales bacterium]|nr:hypothetical protein [Cytophaga sp.]